MHPVTNGMEGRSFVGLQWQQLMPQHHLTHETIAQCLNPAVAASQLLKQWLNRRWSCSKEKCIFSGNGGRRRPRRKENCLRAVNRWLKLDVLFIISGTKQWDKINPHSYIYTYAIYSIYLYISVSLSWNCWNVDTFHREKKNKKFLTRSICVASPTNTTNSPLQ